MSDNIEVVVRVRPALSREVGDGGSLHWVVTGEKKNCLAQVTGHDKTSTPYVFGKKQNKSKLNGFNIPGSK